MEKTISVKNIIIKILALATFLIMAIYVMHFTPVKGYLTAERLGHFLARAGIWERCSLLRFFFSGSLCFFLLYPNNH